MSLYSIVSFSWGQQVFPVKVQGDVLFPSTQISDYRLPENYRILVSLNDVNEFNYNVILKVKFQSDQYAFETATGLPLTLNGGEVYTLDFRDLGTLFAESNLILNPISGDIPEKGAIPEGVYTITYSVFDAAVVPEIPVSNPNTDFTIAAVLRNDPPLLNFPENGAELDLETGNQTILFSWAPRNIVVSPSSPIKYALTIVRVDPADRNPYDALAAGAFMVNDAPFEDLLSPLFLYDPSNFPLEAGATYAWRIEAYEETFDGGSFIKSPARFTNGGLSEVFSFKVKEQCDEVIIQDPIIEPDPINGGDLIALNWSKSPDHQSFEIKYRPAGSVLPWNIVQQSEPRLELTSLQLERGTTYEYSITPKCKGWQPSQYGGMFKLEPKDCEAPKPILVASNDENGILIDWEPVDKANEYRVIVSGGELTTSIDEVIQETERLLDPISNGFYLVQIDGVCGSVTAPGVENQLDFDETNIVGGCPLPEPFSLLATRIGAEEDNDAQLTWSSLGIHQSFDITYWHRDSINAQRTVSGLSLPEVNAIHIFDEQLYKYTVTAHCNGGKSVTSPEGGFRVTGAAGDPIISTGTADCFPPAVVMGEARDSDKARFEWSKVSEAEEYQLFYYLDPDGQEELFTTTSASGLISQLATGTYKFKVRCRCGGEYSIFSDEGSVDLTNVPETNKCDSLTTLSVVEETETELQISWPHPQPSTNGQHSSYVLRYKEGSQLWGDAYTVNLPDWAKLTSEHLNATGDSMRYTIDQLSPGTLYNIEVTAICGDDQAKPNQAINGTTVPTEEKDCVNGECDRSSTEPIADIKVDDLIDIADYQMKIMEIAPDSTDPSKWMGKGLADMPLIGMSENVSTVISFNSLEVNDLNCVLGGDMDVEINLNILPQELRDKIKDIENIVSSTLDSVKNVISMTQNALNVAQQAGNEVLDYFQGGGGKGMPTTGSLGVGITVASDVSSGQTITDPSVTSSPKPVLIQDTGNEIFSVDENNVATLVGHLDPDFLGADSLDTNDQIELTFKKNNNAIYFFDGYQEAYGNSAAMAPHYLVIDGKGKSAKAITPAMLDLVDFDLKGGNVSKLSFVNGEGIVFEKKDNNTLQLAGGPQDDAQIIYAVYDDNGTKTRVGALLLSSYQRKTRELVIVPVKYTKEFTKDINKIETELNATYGRLGIVYNVTLDTTFKSSSAWCSSPACTFTPEGSALLSNNYTGDEKSVMEAYIASKGETDLNADAAYFFAIGSTSDQAGDEALQGKMNFGEQFGFVYSATSLNERTIAKVLAHELGHGNYKFYHSFEKMYLGEDSKGKTDNVMDYADGSHLNKLQWDVAHDPGVTWGIFNRDKDQLKKDRKKKFCEKLNKIIEPHEMYRQDPAMHQTFLKDLSDLNDWVSNKAPEIASELPLYDGNGPVSGGVTQGIPGMLDDDQTHFQTKVLTWYLWKLYCSNVIVTVNHAGIGGASTNVYTKEHVDGDTRYMEYFNYDHKITPNADYTIWVDYTDWFYTLKKGKVDGKMFGEIQTENGPEAYYNPDDLYMFGNGLIENGASSYCALLRTLELIAENEGVSLEMHQLGELTGCVNIVAAKGRVVPKLSLKIEQREVSENEETIDVIIKLNRPAIEDGEVNLTVGGVAIHESQQTTDGEAHSQDNGSSIGKTDYHLSLNVPIKKGDIEVRVPLKTKKDTYEEKNELVVVNLGVLGLDQELKVDPNYQPQEVTIVDYYYPTFAELFNIETHISNEGEVVVKWRTSGEINNFEYRLPSSSDLIQVNPICTGTAPNLSCQVTLDWNELRKLDPILIPRTTEVLYTIRTKNRADEDNVYVTARTGDFQGDNEKLCKYEMIVLGNPNENLPNHKYEWSVSTGRTTSQFDSGKDSAHFKYNIIMSRTYTLKRTHSRVIEVERVIDDNHVDGVYNINDFAQVKVEAIEGCKWKIVAHDETPPPTPSGYTYKRIREAYDDEVLQLIDEDVVYSSTLDAYVLVKDINTAGNTNVYQKGYPKWTKTYNQNPVPLSLGADEVKVRDDIYNISKTREMNPNNPNAFPLYNYDISVLQVDELAPKIEESVGVQFFQRNETQLAKTFAAIGDTRVDKFKSLENLCSWFVTLEDKINHPFDVIEHNFNKLQLFEIDIPRIQLPLRCKPTVFNTKMWLAEVHDEKDVVLEKGGKITFPFEGQFGLSYGPFSATPAIDELAIDFDTKNRHREPTWVEFDKTKRTWSVIFSAGFNIVLFDATENQNDQDGNGGNGRRPTPYSGNGTRCPKSAQCKAPAISRNGGRCPNCTGIDPSTGKPRNYCPIAHSGLENEDSEGEGGSWWDFLKLEIGLRIDAPLNINFNACGVSEDCGVALSYSIGKIVLVPTCSIASGLVEKLKVTLYSGSGETDPYPIY